MDDPGGGGGGSSSTLGAGAVPKVRGGPVGIQPSTSSNNEPFIDFGHRKKYNNKPRATDRQLSEYYTMYRNENNFDKYFTLSANNQTSLSEIDTIKANEDLESHLGGSPANIRELRSGSILVEVRSKEQSRAIRELKKLAGYDITVRSDDNLNQCKGTIYYRNGPNYTEEQICQALNKSGNTPVASVYRTKKKINGNLVELPIYQITFQSTQLPTHVTIGWTRCSTRLYIPRPRRCFNCQGFGHGTKTCRKTERVCVNCSESYCDTEEHPNPCTTAPKCANCGDSHSASSFDCNHYKMEQEVLNLQAYDHLTYSAAKRRVKSLRTPAKTNIPVEQRSETPLSYSAVTRLDTRKTPEKPNDRPSQETASKPETAFKNMTYNNLNNPDNNIALNQKSPVRENRKRNLSDPPPTNQSKKHSNNNKGYSPGPMPQNAPPYNPSKPPSTNYTPSNKETKKNPTAKKKQ